MAKTFRLSPNHYASGWNMDTVNDRMVVNQLAVDYASLADGPDKEDKLLEILKAFHNFTSKYGSMITSGHLPPSNSPAGRDAAKMLFTLLPKGTKASRQSLGAACRTLHLAFKQHTHDDIYDILATCIMKAARKYDPFYTNKIKSVCGKIDESDLTFTEPDITGRVGFNSLGCLRLLVRRGHLISIAEEGKVVGYKRAQGWPPPKEFFESGPVGFAYFLPMYFRYYLHEHIASAMGEIESKDGVLQLGHSHSYIEDQRTSAHNPRMGDEPRHANVQAEGSLPNSEGNIIDSKGRGWSADISMVVRGWDLSTMDENWIHSTTDRLFRNLTTSERYLLYLHFVEEFKWPEIAEVLDISTSAAQKMFKEIMVYLKGHARELNLGSAQ